ncbi:VWA domain-containing protein [Pseudomonas silvicola]|nr:VWA domain-containing protein [Pseudomonas silvicola]
MQLTQGQRLPLSSILQGDQLTLSLTLKSPHVIDYACFGIDAAGKLSDDRYMVFFNQPATPCASVRLAHEGAFSLNLTTLPATIERLVFTAAIDGYGAMRDLAPSAFAVQAADGATAATCEFQGRDFASEKAIMVADLYRKDGAWRLQANLQGFNDGLDALVRHFGGEVQEQPVVPARISLEKKIADAAPHLLSLAKKAQLSLEKNNLANVTARVALVLDVSGSMNGQYNKGRVQEVVNRLVPLAVHFDDDGELDCWGFAAKPQQLPAVSLANHKDYVNTVEGGWKRWNLGARVNDEPKVIRQVIDYYKRSGDLTPVYVMFISDGGVHENKAITQLIVEAARYPVFWQFVGLGGSSYGILEKLDTLPGRVVDNCGFFALDDLHDVSEEALYDKLMNEFPSWLKEARGKGILG